MINFENEKTTISSLISSANEASWNGETKRNYIGASLLGHPCMRYIQYEFQCDDKGTSPRPENIRKMQMGHEFEHKMRSWMIQCGFEFEEDPQPTIPFPEKMGGHVDGIIIKSPLNITLPAVWESKSIAKTGYVKLLKHKLKLSNQRYYVQLQLYMYFFGCDIGVFTAINRDTCEIYEEIVDIDMQTVNVYMNNFDFIVHNFEGGTLVPRMASNPDNYMCKMCSHINTCWGEN